MKKDRKFTGVLNNNPEAMKTELDRMGPPKSCKVPNNFKHRNFRSTNYFYRVFDHIGRQLALVNQGLNDSGPKRVWQIK